jgi:hypothetical protein
MGGTAGAAGGRRERRISCIPMSSSLIVRIDGQGWRSMSGRVWSGFMGINQFKEWRQVILVAIIRKPVSSIHAT